VAWPPAAWKTPLQLPSILFLACLLPKCLLGLTLSFFYGSASEVRPSSSKSAPALSVFDDFMCNQALVTVLCAFCRTLSPIKPRNCGNRDPPSATTADTLPEKIQGFAPDSVLKPEFTRSRSLTLPNYLHDDVVAMMIEVIMWLPSWWER